MLSHKLRKNYKISCYIIMAQEWGLDNLGVLTFVGLTVRQLKCKALIQFVIGVH